MAKKATSTKQNYEAPKLDTYSGDEILRLLGPALAVYGSGPGGP